MCESDKGQTVQIPKCLNAKDMTVNTTHMTEPCPFTHLFMIKITVIS